jgi:glyoxylase-like metal-dependent hydrolase (beta-lactamase superfamily II)
LTFQAAFMHKILEGVYGVQGLGVGRVYVITGGDGLTLIDASVEGAERGIARELARMNYALKDIRRILITHAHPDHSGALAALVKASGAQVYAHALEGPIVRGAQPVGYKETAFMRAFSRLLGIRGMPPAQVDRTIAEGDTLPEVLPDLQVIEAPGHTAGQIAFYSPSRKLLFCGDAMTHFGRLGLPLAPFTSDMAEAKRSVKKLAALVVETLCFGHGAPIVRNASAQLRAFAARL